MSWSALFSGDAVEVSDDKGEFTWQPASIIHPFISCHMYFVAFDTAVNAIVSSVRVRPRPESDHFISNFELNQLVDVKIGGIWRSGIVCKVHVAEGNKFYGVNVEGREIEIENGAAEIRAMVDWVDGKWSLATEKGRPTTSHDIGNSNSTSEALTDAVNPMRNLTDEAPCRKSMAGIEKKDVDKENKRCSNNLNFQSCKEARNEPKHSEFSSAKKMEVGVCMPVSKEDPNFNIKSMADKLHRSKNNLSQESTSLSNKEGILRSLFLQIANQHTSGERRRKKSLPRKLVIVEPSLQGEAVIKKPCLPFEKSSVVWESLKSMEIFTSMPQDPHFSPLVEQPVVHREGMAIGLMVTFSNLALSIPKLNLSDPPKKFDDIAKALHDLQEHGFTVRELQSRLTELIKIKEEYERATAVCVELTKEMESNNGSVSEMEQVLSCLNEARCRGLSEQKEKDSRLDQMMTDMLKFQDDVLDAKLVFQALLPSFL